MELAKGQYQIFIGTGDLLGTTYTDVCIEGQTVPADQPALKPGAFRALIVPFTQIKDGIAKIRFSTKKNLFWSASFMIVNRIF